MNAPFPEHQNDSTLAPPHDSGCQTIYQSSLHTWLNEGRAGQWVLIAEGVEPLHFSTLEEALDEADRRSLPFETSFVDEIRVEIPAEKIW